MAQVERTESRLPPEGPLDRAFGWVCAVLNAAGVGDADLVSRIEDPALDEALNRATATAVERGVFGAPVMFVGDEMFFGNDRLDFVRDALARQEAA